MVLCRRCYIHYVFFQCLQYKTDQAQDVKKIEKLHGKLMRLMVSKESHSGAMETDWMNQRNCWDWTVVCYSIRLTMKRNGSTAGWRWCLVDVFWLYTENVLDFARLESKQKEHLTRGWFLCSCLEVGQHCNDYTTVFIWSAYYLMFGELQQHQGNTFWSRTFLITVINLSPEVCISMHDVHWT